MSRLPAAHLADYYLDGKALRKLEPPSLLAASVYPSASQPAAGTLTADGTGLHLTQLTLGASSGAGHPAGVAASMLPGDVIAYVSLQDLHGTVNRLYQQFHKSGLVTADTARALDPTLRDLTSSMAGEADLVVFHPDPALKQQLGFGSAASLMWQVNDEAGAAAGLSDALKRMGTGTRFSPATAADGSRYRVMSGGSGYATRKGWAITSLAIGKTMDTLASINTTHLASVPGYQEAIPAGSSPSSIWYLNLRQLRTQLETTALGFASRSDAAQYHTNVLPLLAPLQTLAGSSGETSDHRFTLTTVTLRVGSS